MHPPWNRTLFFEVAVASPHLVVLCSTHDKPRRSPNVCLCDGCSMCINKDGKCHVVDAAYAVDRETRTTVTLDQPFWLDVVIFSLGADTEHQADDQSPSDGHPHGEQRAWCLPHGCLVLIALARTHTARGFRSFQPHSVQTASDDPQRPYHIVISRIMVTLSTHQQRLSPYKEWHAAPAYEYMASEALYAAETTASRHSVRKVPPGQIMDQDHETGQQAVHESLVCV